MTSFLPPNLSSHNLRGLQKSSPDGGEGLGAPFKTFTSNFSTSMMIRWHTEVSHNICFILFVALVIKPKCLPKITEKRPFSGNF